MFLVSIIIPIYKVEPYIEQCILSVLNQTYRHLEVILVNDCTPDHSLDIAKEVIEKSEKSKDLNIIYLNHEKNRGLSAARNTGIENSNGDFLYFLDSDDQILPECIESMVACLSNYPESDIVVAGAKAIGNRTESFGWLDFEKKDLPDYSDNRDWIKHAFMRRYYLIMTSWGKLIKKDFLSRNNINFAEGYVHEDEIFNLNLAINVQKIAICKKNLYLYLIRDNSIMGTKLSMDETIKRRLKCWYKMLEEIEGVKDSMIICDFYNFVNDKYNSTFGLTNDVHKELQNFMLKLSRKASWPTSLLMATWVFIPLKIRSKHSYNYRFKKILTILSK